MRRRWRTSSTRAHAHGAGHGPARARWASPPSRRGLAAIALALVGLFAVAPTASAEPPTRLDGQITDTVGALAGAEGRVAAAQAELQAESAIQLWVAYVATFDGLSGQEWADATAAESGLGGNDMLFAVAIEDRAYGYSVDDSFGLSDATISRIIAEDVEPELVAGDWPGAVVALADGLGSADAGAAGDQGAGGSEGGGLPWGVLLGGGVLLVGALAAIALMRRRSRGAGARGSPGTGGPGGSAPTQAPIEELRQQAAAALIDADDAIRTSEQELGFAVAQFGEESAGPFRESLVAARADLQRAFELQRLAQQLAEGSAVPESASVGPRPGAGQAHAGTGPGPGQQPAAWPGATAGPRGEAAMESPAGAAPRLGPVAAGAAPGPAASPDAAADGAPRTERDALENILALCAAVDDRLDAEVESFDQLRDLEQALDSVLPGLTARASELSARLPGARSTADDLATRYPPAALAAVTANLQEAEERLRFAEESLQQGTDLATGGDRSAAATRARAAEESLGQAATLLDGVDAAPSVLDLAQRSVAALIAETERDLAEAERLGVPAQTSAVHHYASETLAWARASVESGNYDPILVRRALEESDSALEQALVPERELAATRARAEALLPTATEAAEVSVRIVDDFITTRRGAVGAEARTRLAEAQRRLAAGRHLTDPVAALAEMQAADHLADQANALAQQDVARYGDQQRRGGGPGNLGGAILGGILIDAMVRGGAGHARGRPSGGFGGGFRPSGGRAPSSFGGGGTRGRRSGGGRF